VKERIESPAHPFKALQRLRAFEEVIDQIEHAIADGQLRPGERLPPERELAVTFGVSRTSVREALRVLEMFGVIATRRGTGPDSGTIVASSAEIGLASALRLHSALLQIPTQDLVDVRVALESYAASHAAYRRTSADLDELRRLIEAMHACDKREEFYSLDTRFHLALASCSGNALLPVLMEALRASMEREMSRTFSELRDWPAERERLRREHDALLSAVESKDAARAEQLVRDHIVRFYASAEHA
jgi:GntR family transcriptional repressor for pyruvate dehydrogenase complex